MKSAKKVSNLIEAISKHQDEQEALRVLDDLGTNCPSDDVRELTSRYLIRKNTSEALRLVIINRGKGINDLSAKVAMCAINELLALKDKSEAIKILDETIEQNEEKEVQDTARSVKALMSFSS